MLSAGNRSDLRSWLSKKWEDMRDLYVHSDQPESNDPIVNPTMCSRLGMCVCEGLGLKALRFHQKFVLFLKPEFTPRRRRKKKQADGSYKVPELPPAEKAKQEAVAGHRRLLQESFVVLHLQHPECRSGNSSTVPFQTFSLDASWSDMALRALGASANPQEAGDVWVHIGHMNFTTWTMAVLQLFPDEQDREDGRVKLLVNQPFKASDALSLWSSMVDINLRWLVTVYTIVSDYRELSLPEMVPNWVLVKQLPSVPPMQFWQGWELEEDMRIQKANAKN